jgi:GT2 family glycosyltransferase/glycosyltransferase involved in cell wall biosynthesis
LPAAAPIGRPELTLDLPLLDDVLAHAPRSQATAVVDVVVPVYAGLRDTLRCILSLLESRPQAPFEIVVVNDASPDLLLSSCLRLIAERGLITLLRNDTNQGFVRTANRGIARSPGRDVVLLNSDTEVYGDWLDRLRRAAHSAPDVGTVTPLSNNATICSYPRFIEENTLPPGLAPPELDALCARLNPGELVDVPTGVGFCMYLRRDCVSRVGLLDAETFGRGYGEENDFSLRARAAGWRSVLTTDTFVYHKGGVSFGTEKVPAVERAVAVLNQKHPDYPALVAGHVAGDPALPYRRRIDLARIGGDGPAVLFVTHAWGGGTERHVQDVAARLEGEGVSAVVLRPASRTASGTLVRLERPGVPVTPNLVFDARDEFWTLAAALRQLGVEHVHVHHTITLPAEVLDLVRELRLPYDWTAHDYFAVCPRINLIDGTGTYCGEPNLQGCQMCVEKNGSYAGPGVDVGEWRATHHRWLAGARRVIVPHADVARRLGRYFPGVEFAEQRHFEHVARARPVAAPLAPGEPLRVAVLGVLVGHKGLEVVRGCARDAAERDLPLRFCVVGPVTDPALLDLPTVSCTGEYAEDEVFDVLERERCHLAFFPSVWPETYSYTLSVALTGGLFPVTFDLGAPAERVREAGFGRVIPLTTDAAVINEHLLGAAGRLGPPPGDLAGLFPEYRSILADYYGLAGRARAAAA